jgi:hypothetical protein
MSKTIRRIVQVTAALAVASVIGFTLPSLAQGDAAVGAIRLAEAGQAEQKKKAGAPRQGAPRQDAAPKRAVAPKQVDAPRRDVTPRRTVTPRQDGAPRRAVTPKREVTPRRTVTPKQDGTPRRAVTPKREVTPRRTVTPKQDGTPRVVAPRDGSPRVGSSRPGLRAIGARSTGRVFVRGQNYTVWRGSHRVRHGNRWRTFGPLSALSVLLVGGASYYPYAYLSTPRRVCEGETEDGCVLQWQEVPTLEGPRLYQCVAYCPWQ